MASVCECGGSCKRCRALAALLPPDASAVFTPWMYDWSAVVSMAVDHPENTQGEAEQAGQRLWKHIERLTGERNTAEALLGYLDAECVRLGLADIDNLEGEWVVVLPRFYRANRELLRVLAEMVVTSTESRTALNPAAYALSKRILKAKGGI